MIHILIVYTCVGYSALEDYKDRICSTLPGDYNNTAVRLQTLIGASDHMIQWILTGDMSKVNHRIYQVVLVYVCFEPHFIKFCDIMEVLVADDRYIMELRTSNSSVHMYVIMSYCMLYMYIYPFIYVPIKFQSYILHRCVNQFC